jgi:hypothetical protein
MLAATSAFFGQHPLALCKTPFSILMKIWPKALLSFFELGELYYLGNNVFTNMH